MVHHYMAHIMKNCLKTVSNMGAQHEKHFYTEVHTMKGEPERWWSTPRAGRGGLARELGGCRWAQPAEGRAQSPALAARGPQCAADSRRGFENPRHRFLDIQSEYFRSLHHRPLAKRSALRAATICLDPHSRGKPQILRSSDA